MPVKIKAELSAPSDAFVSTSKRQGVRSFHAPVVATSGDRFRAWQRQSLQVAAAAVTAAVAAGADGLKTDIRRRIIEADLGESLPNAVRSETYPRGQDSLSAAGWVFTKGKRTLAILQAYSDGATIRARNGRYLAIPTEAAGRGGGRFGRMTPTAWRYRRGAPLRLVVPKDPNKPLLLVARLRQGKGKRGGFRVPTAGAIKRKDFEWVVIFILVKQVEVKSRIRIDDLGQSWADKIPSLIDQALPNL